MHKNPAICFSNVQGDLRCAVPMFTNLVPQGSCNVTTLPLTASTAHIEIKSPIIFASFIVYLPSMLGSKAPLAVFAEQI